MVATKSLSGHGRTVASNYIPAQYNLPIRVDSNFKWGVNGHPLVQPAYFGNITLQMSLLKELQVGYYRIDINCDRNGRFNSPYSNELFSAAVANNITLIPMMHAPDSIKDIPLADAEREGRVMAAGFTSISTYWGTTIMAKNYP